MIPPHFYATRRIVRGLKIVTWHECRCERPSRHGLYYFHDPTLQEARP